jgi:hypothetical protein
MSRCNAGLFSYLPVPERVPVVAPVLPDVEFGNAGFPDGFMAVLLPVVPWPNVPPVLAPAVPLPGEPLPPTALEAAPPAVPPPAPPPAPPA